MGLILGLLGGFSSILRAVPAKAWAVIGCVALVLLVGWRVQAWAAGKDRQIAAAHAETLVARRQTGNAILYGVGRQAQVFADASSIAALRTSLDRQSAAVTAAEAEGQRRDAALATANRQATEARGRADRASAALLAGRAGRDPCVSALDVARSLP